MADAMPDLLAVALAAALSPSVGVAVAEAVRERVLAWLAGAEAHAPALLLGLALLLAVPPLALAGLAARRLLAREREDEAAAERTVRTGVARPGHAWLEVEDGHRVAIDGEIVRIGREDDNELCIEGGAVHRYHAVVQRTPDQGFVITDVSSGNGVRVNGEWRQRRRLRDGDRLEIGGTAILFHLDPAA